MIHTSGYSDANTVKQLIETVNPKVFIPMHTENAERFNEGTPGVINHRVKHVLSGL